MSIDKFLLDGQDGKVVDKIHAKIVDMLDSDESILYIAVQKKPAVTLLPDCIAVSNKRLFLCEFTKLGLATNFEIFSWSDVKDIAFKEEIFGSKVTVIPFTGENLTIDYIPKVQARKLYQLIKDALEQANKPVSPLGKITEIHTSIVTEEIAPAAQPEIIELDEHTDYIFDLPVETATTENVVEDVVYASEAPMPQIEAPEDDELTQKLKKLKGLYDRQLITQSEYENKKSELLSQL